MSVLIDESFQVLDPNKRSIDQNQTWRRLEARIAIEDNPRRRRILELVLAHVQSEAKRDLDGVLATLVDRPVYRMFNRPDPELNPPSDRESIIKFYDKLVFGPGAYRIEFDMENILVGDDACLTEGPSYWAVPGVTLSEWGVEGAQTDAWYVTATRGAVIWPYSPEEDRLVGELVYEANDGLDGILSRKITAQQIIGPES
jgi:hypothetical protein